MEKTTTNRQFEIEIKETTTTKRPFEIEIERKITNRPFEMEMRKTTTNKPFEIEIKGKTTTNRPFEFDMQKTTTNRPFPIEFERRTTQRPFNIEIAEKTTTKSSLEINIREHSTTTKSKPHFPQLIFQPTTPKSLREIVIRGTTPTYVYIPGKYKFHVIHCETATETRTVTNSDGEIILLILPEDSATTKGRIVGPNGQIIKVHENHLGYTSGVVTNSDGYVTKIILPKPNLRVLSRSDDDREFVIQGRSPQMVTSADGHHISLIYGYSDTEPQAITNSEGEITMIHLPKYFNSEFSFVTDSYGRKIQIYPHQKGRKPGVFVNRYGHIQEIVLPKPPSFPDLEHQPVDHDFKIIYGQPDTETRVITGSNGRMIILSLPSYPGRLPEYVDTPEGYRILLTEDNPIEIPEYVTDKSGHITEVLLPRRPRYSDIQRYPGIFYVRPILRQFDEADDDDNDFKIIYGRPDIETQIIKGITNHLLLLPSYPGKIPHHIKTPYGYTIRLSENHPIEMPEYFINDKGHIYKIKLPKRPLYSDVQSYPGFYYAIPRRKMKHDAPLDQSDEPSQEKEFHNPLESDKPQTDKPQNDPRNPSRFDKPRNGVLNPSPFENPQNEFPNSSPFGNPQNKFQNPFDKPQKDPQNSSRFEKPRYGMLNPTQFENPQNEFPNFSPFGNPENEFPNPAPFGNPLNEFPNSSPFGNPQNEFPNRSPFEIPQNNFQNPSPFNQPQNRPQNPSQFDKPQNGFLKPSPIQNPQDEFSNFSPFGNPQNEFPNNSPFGYPQNEFQNPSQFGNPRDEFQNPSQFGNPRDEFQNPSRYENPLNDSPDPSRFGSPRNEWLNPSRYGRPQNDFQSPLQFDEPQNDYLNPSQDYFDFL